MQMIGGGMNCSTEAAGSGAYTLAEFSLALNTGGQDFYDISLCVIVLFS